MYIYLYIHTHIHTHTHILQMMHDIYYIWEHLTRESSVSPLGDRTFCAYKILIYTSYPFVYDFLWSSMITIFFDVISWQLCWHVQLSQDAEMSMVYTFRQNIKSPQHNVFQKIKEVSEKLQCLYRTSLIDAF